MQEILLTKGYVALVDDLDYHWIAKYRWYTDAGKWNVYAKNDSLPGRPRMHVFIMQPEPGFIVNHVDRNGLNNTRNNLEIITQAEHSRLSSRRSNTKQKYRGVTLHRTGKFTAEIWVNYKKYYLGLFKTDIEAAQAYNNAGERLLGRGNFIMNEVNIYELLRARET